MYELYYQLAQVLQREPAAIDEQDLYDFDNDQIYAAVMNRLAQPLPTGEESPFSNQSPGTAHGNLMSNVVFLLALQGNEFALMPDVMLLNWMRTWGASRRLAEYPLINLRFTRDLGAIANNLRAEIPAGTEVISRNDSSLVAIVIDDAVIDGVDESKLVPARLNRLGKIDSLQFGEFSILTQLLSNVESVRNEEVISQGRPDETISEAVLRMRDRLRRGERAVTDRDHQRIALEAGADKVNFIRGRVPGIKGFFRDARTIAVLPAGMVQIVKAVLEDQRLADERIEIIPAEVIPIDGLIQIRIEAGLADYQAFNLAAQAIVNNINPPNGNWGDLELAKSIATALEQVKGIYATPTVDLKHAITGEKLIDLSIEPWHLFEIQQSVTIEILR